MTDPTSFATGVIVAAAPAFAAVALAAKWSRHAVKEARRARGWSHDLIDDVGTSGVVRRRLWSAWQVLRGRPFAIEVQWGPEAVALVGTSDDDEFPGIPALTVPTDSLPLSVGWGNWRWDGKRFPFATMGPAILTFDDDEATTVTVRIPVRMAGASGNPDDLPSFVAGSVKAMPAKDGMALVGEQGPEVVILPRGGIIRPHEDPA